MSASNGQLELCGWCLPDEAHVDRTHVTCCIRPPGHDDKHVVGEEAGDASVVNFYEIDDDGLTMRPVVHVDLKPGDRLGRDGLVALWALTAQGRGDWIER